MMENRITGKISSSNNKDTQSSPKTIFPGRVRYCMLDDKTHPTSFKAFGEWASMGSVFFSRLDSPNPEKDFNSDNIAHPLFPNNKIFPLENELIYIIPLPGTDAQSNVNSIDYYYFQPINLWNSVHHNAIPDPINGENLPESQQRDYQQTEKGAARKVMDEGTGIKLGNTFKEKINIKNLQPFEGDILYEGRWGQSIRLGSTINNSNIKNPWSIAGKNGDSIMIIRAGQYKDQKDPWIPQVEDINKDISSIYCTSTQALPIEVASNNYKSYSTPPTSPNKFEGEQIILNSGRLLFNSKSDSILFSSKKTINLNSIDSVNIDSPKFILNSKEILLGDKNAKESLILGDKFFSDFENLLQKINAMASALQSPIGSPVPYVPNTSLVSPAVQLASSTQKMISNIDNYKSKISKTK